MIEKRSMEMGCRAFLLVVGLATALTQTSFAQFGGFGGFGGQQGGNNQGGKKKKPLTMVLPDKSLGNIQSMNRSVNFNKIGLSQAAFGDTISQAAIVSASQLGGGSPGMMFLPYGQLGGIQGANIDLNINVMAVTQLAVGRNIQQVAIVSVAQDNSSDDEDGYGGEQQGGGQQGGGLGGQQGGGLGGQQGGGLGGQQGGGHQQGGGKDLTLVAPWNDVPMLKAVNKSLNYNVMRVSQVGIGDNIGQTAILSVGQSNGGGGAGGLGGTPMLVPADQVGAYKALNLSLNINVITVTQVAIGNNIQQLALITVGQSN